MTSLKDIFVPDIGDFKDIPVIEVLVKPGDTVNAEDSIITLESDKATMEVPAPTSGIIKEIKISPGDTVSEGSLILSMEASQTESRTSQTKSDDLKPVKQNTLPENNVSHENPPDLPKPNPIDSDSTTLYSNEEQPRTKNSEIGNYASPGVRRLARELGVDLSKVTGTGQKNRILKEDVHTYVKKSLSKSNTPDNQPVVGVIPAISVDFSKYGEIEKKDLSRIKKISGPILHRNWVQIPHITQHHEADVTELEKFRKEISKRSDVKITPVAFVIKALGMGLAKYPHFNSSLSESGGGIIIKKYINIGVAVDTPHGLVVPVVRDVNNKGVIEIAKELSVLSDKARKSRLSPTDMEGGTFSVSSLGGIGGGHFTPIINAPEVAILGINRSKFKPIWNGDKFDACEMLPLSLSYDHRVIDGAEGSRFIVYLSSLLNDLKNGLL